MRALPAAIAFLLILTFFGFMGCAGVQKPADESSPGSSSASGADFQAPASESPASESPAAAATTEEPGAGPEDRESPTAPGAENADDAQVPAAAPPSDVGESESASAGTAEDANAAADETASTGDDPAEDDAEIAAAAGKEEPSGASGDENGADNGAGAVAAADAAPDEVAAPADPSAAAAATPAPAAGDTAPAATAAATDNTKPADATREVVFNSSAVPMTEPEDTGLTLDLQGKLNQPELSRKQTLDEPLPPPLPDPLGGDQINRLVFTGIGEGLLPVHRSGSAVYLLHDLDGNGYSDVFALALRVETREDAEFANIHDYTRLYKPERKAARFYLRLFYQRNGTLVPADLVSLGERLVMDSFHPQAIVEGENSPFAVSIAFTTLQGRVREWIIFAGGEPGRFSMQERAGEIPVIEDIDSDGVIDVLIYEKVYEIGIGNETYITWYRWNGFEFAPVATVNIVRNLREFLETAFDLINRREWESFSEHALSKSIRGMYPKEMYSGFSVFQQAFELAVVEESFKNRPLDPSESIRRAVYPEIRENPFSQRDSTGFFFPLSVRFKTDSGHNHLYTTRVYMLPNPFGERQFTFSLDADGSPDNANHGAPAD